MGRVTWGGGLSASDIDDADRSQFKPYDGPTPPDGLYAWKVKQLKRGVSSNDNDQLIIGLELIPRRSRPEEKAYKGYYVTQFLVMTESTGWKVAGFTDALGVTGRDLIERTKEESEEDSRGNTKIISIGKWLNDGKTIILGTLEKDDYTEGRKRIRDFWPVEELVSATKEADDETDETEEEEEPPPRRTTKKAAPAKRASRRADPEPEDEEEEPPARAAKKAPAKKAAARRAEPDDDDEDDGEAPF